MLIEAIGGIYGGGDSRLGAVVGRYVSLGYISGGDEAGERRKVGYILKKVGYADRKVV